MKITALVENTSLSELKSIHGLSLYIETKKHRILFDLGPDMTLFENAKTLNIDLNAVDTVIISHGHEDHGGGLEEFLKVNNTSKVYVQRSAFDEHYSQPFSTRNYIGLNEKLQSNPQVILLDGDYIIDEELRLFTVTDQSKYHSPTNDTLYGKDGKDDFSHEQNLIIKEDKVALIMGCGHAGIVNILDKAATDRYHELSQQIKYLEKRMAEITELKKHIISYAKTKKVYTAYRESGYSGRFYEANTEDILLHQSAKQAFSLLSAKQIPSMKNLQLEYQECLSAKKSLSADYSSVKSIMKQSVIIKNNVDLIMGASCPEKK